MLHCQAQQHPIELCEHGNIQCNAMSSVCILGASSNRIVTIQCSILCKVNMNTLNLLLEY